MEGIVDLALERAERDDTKLLAVMAYKNHCGENDVFAQEAFARRFLHLFDLLLLNAFRDFYFCTLIKLRILQKGCIQVHN